MGHLFLCSFNICCSAHIRSNFYRDKFRMFSKAISRTLSTSIAAQKKVAVLGAAGGIGQPLALLLKVRFTVFDLTTTYEFSLTQILPESAVTMLTQSPQVSALIFLTSTPRLQLPPSLAKTLKNRSKAVMSSLSPPVFHASQVPFVRFLHFVPTF